MIKTEGPTPGRRYGHTLSYASPFLVVFGGCTATELVNDSWVLLIKQTPFRWQRLDFKSEVPSPRVYHSAAICFAGKASGMIIVFGGRCKDQSTLADSWGLRRHRDGAWEWIKAPHNGEEKPVSRFQVSQCHEFGSTHRYSWER